MRGNDRRIPMRYGRINPNAGTQCTQQVPRGLWIDSREDTEMTLMHDRDLGTPERVSTDLLTLEIDGQTVEVPVGTSVMRAAALIGNDIPKLCATDSLEPFGSCRLCIV